MPSTEKHTAASCACFLAVTPSHEQGHGCLCMPGTETEFRSRGRIPWFFPMPRYLTDHSNWAQYLGRGESSSRSALSRSKNKEHLLAYLSRETDGNSLGIVLCASYRWDEQNGQRFLSGLVQMCVSETMMGSSTVCIQNEGGCPHCRRGCLSGEEMKLQMGHECHMPQDHAAFVPGIQKEYRIQLQ